MDILISGAGIAGLTAAVALRRNGHRVTIFEQSRLNQETGAAIFLPPNANGLLREFGFVPENYGANLSLEWRFYFIDGTIEIQEKFSEHEFEHPWQMIHRQELHRGLKELALDPAQPGTPVNIKLSSRVTSVDPETATVHFEDGTSVKGDTVLGADGTHSVTRDAVQLKYGTNIKPYWGRSSAFRFLVPRKDLANDPVAKNVFSANNTLMVWHGEGKKVVCYPCDENATVNFVVIHPAERSDAGGNEWNSGGSKGKMTEIFSHFPPEVRAALNLADPAKIKLYPLMDMDQLPGWTNGRATLLGDAAHPFLPHMAQGGAQAIEDGVSIGVFLPADTKPAEVPRRLELYELARKDRAHSVQTASRIAGEQKSELEGGSNDDRLAFRNFMFRHNEAEHSAEILQAHMKEIAA